MELNSTNLITPEEKASCREENNLFFSKIPIPIIYAALLLLMVIVWYGFYTTHTKGVTCSDDREYASIARYIVNGQGIVKDSIMPLEINFYKKIPIPDFMHPPGYPLIIAGFFKLFGVSDSVALLPSHLSYFILVFLVFYFVKKYVNVKTAVAATIILIFNKEILDYSCIAMSESVYLLFFFFFIILIIGANSLKAVFFAGVILGCSHLIRENIYPVFIPSLFFLYLYPNISRWKKMGTFIFGFLMPISVMIIMNYLTTGEPFFSYGKYVLMAYSDKYPGLNIYRDIQNPSLIEFILRNPSQFLLKYLDNLIKALEQIMRFSNPYLLAFFIMEMFNWKISPDQKKLKILLLLLLIFQILFISLFTIIHRYFIPFLPVMILFAAQCFLRVSDNVISISKERFHKGVRLFMVFVFLIFFILPTSYFLIHPPKAQTSRFGIPQFGYLLSRNEALSLNEFLSRELDKNQVIWTDLPEILEWEGNRPSGWIPTRVATLYDINNIIPVDAILLTSVRTPLMETEWQYLLFNEATLPYYRTVKLYKRGKVFAKLFIRDGKE